jgi:hypothetical protein
MNCWNTKNSNDRGVWNGALLDNSTRTDRFNFKNNYDNYRQMLSGPWAGQDGLHLMKEVSKGGIA